MCQLPSTGCGKVGFSKRQAQEALNIARRGERGKRGKEKRIYHCEACNKWHLTKSFHFTPH